MLRTIGLMPLLAAAACVPGYTRAEIVYAEPAEYVYVAPPERVVVVTREVLGRRGFEVIRVETVGNDQIVWYRAGHRGRRGRGNGPPLRMVIRRDPVANKVVFLQTPSDILVDIDVKLR